MSAMDWNETMLLAATGEHGSSILAQAVYWGTASTGIVHVWRKKTWDDPGELSFCFRDRSYVNFYDAVDAWKRAGSPEEEPRAADTYLDPKNFEETT